MPTTNPSPSARILVVDDESHIREILARVLGNAGYTIVEAASTSDALEQLERASQRKTNEDNANSKHVSSPFDLVITDLQMPGLRGEDLQRIVKERFPQLPIIVITAVADVDTAVECMRLGAADYILKPFLIADMLVRVKRALSQH